MSGEKTEKDVPLGEVARAFTRLGLIAFGGPAAHVALMHREFVKRRRWIDDARFLDHFALTNLIPGPNSTELAMLVGAHASGLRGLLIAGVAFIVPASLIVLALAYAYVEYGSTPAGEGLMYGIAPVVIAIVLHALLDLVRKALRGALLISIAVAAAIVYLLGVNELIVIAAAGVVVLVVRTRPSGAASVLPLGAFTLASSTDVSLERLFLIFLKIGAVLYGSGYVLLAFLRTDLVDRLGWLTEQQLIDAVAVGQFTPGPVFTTATFVGYVVAGFSGALVTTVGIFLPSFFLSAIVGRIGPWLRAKPPAAAFLDGLTAGSLGLMAGVTWQLAREAIVDPLTVALAAIAILVLVRSASNPTWLIVGGAVVGLISAAI